MRIPTILLPLSFLDRWKKLLNQLWLTSIHVRIHPLNILNYNNIKQIKSYYNYKYNIQGVFKRPYKIRGERKN